jgi:hypothetical protein
MTTYYVDTSQTFNGDGTTSGAAGSDGAVGASNSLWTIRTGSHPYITLAAGDSVYVRTWDGAANCFESGITSTNASSAGVGTAELPVNYYFDDGTVWVGDSGQFILSTDGSEYIIQFDAYANVFAGDHTDRRFKLNFTHTATSGTQPIFRFSIGENHGCHFESVGGLTLSTVTYTNGSHVIAKDLFWKAGDSWYSITYYPFMKGTYHQSLLLINPVFDVSLCTVNSQLMSLNRSGQGESARVIGGEIIGGYEGLELLYNGPGGQVQYDILIEGFDYGSVVKPLDFDTTNTFPLLSQSNSLQLVSCGKTYNYSAQIGGIMLNYTPEDLYPTKTAVLPDIAETLWSIRAFLKGCYPAEPTTLPKIEKFYSQPAAGSKTFSIELLAQSTPAAPDFNKRDIYLIVQYIDDVSGALRIVSSKDTSGGALTASSGWSATSYGAFGFTAKKVEVAMLAGDTIKQNTPIKAWLVCGVARIGDNDSFIYNPDLDIV